MAAPGFGIFPAAFLPPGELKKVQSPRKVVDRFMITPGKAGYWEHNIYRRFARRTVQVPKKDQGLVAVKMGLHTPAHRL